MVTDREGRPAGHNERVTGQHELRTDPYLGTRVHVVRDRQKRPNLPSTGCPFCIGGVEAPEPYVATTFVNRWPAMEGDRCEVVLYTPEHDATFAGLGAAGAREVIDLWAARTEQLGARRDIDFVLVFENRGAEVGATISHPHGQIYAYDHVPDRPRRRFEAGWSPDPAPGERAIIAHGTWKAWVPVAATFPVAIDVAPVTRVPDLPSLDETSRNDLAVMLIDLFGRLDRLFDQPLPLMMWWNQRPFTGGFDDAWLHLEIVSPWRSAGVPRFIAAAEVACEEYFNPVVPEDLAARLRDLG